MKRDSKRKSFSEDPSKKRAKVGAKPPEGDQPPSEGLVAAHGKLMNWLLAFKPFIHYLPNSFSFFCNARFRTVVLLGGGVADYLSKTYPDEDWTSKFPKKLCDVSVRATQAYCGHHTHPFRKRCWASLIGSTNLLQLLAGQGKPRNLFLASIFLAQFLDCVSETTAFQEFGNLNVCVSYRPCSGSRIWQRWKVLVISGHGNVLGGAISGFLEW